MYEFLRDFWGKYYLHFQVSAGEEMLHISVLVWSTTCFAFSQKARIHKGDLVYRAYERILLFTGFSNLHFLVLGSGRVQRFLLLRDPWCARQRR